MNQLQQLAARLTASQKIGLLAATVAVIGGLMALERWNRDRGFSPVFSGLAADDAGPIAAQLREAQIDYRVADGGSTILVKDDRVAEVRLQLAAAGLPHSGRIGFELFDQTNFGASEFAEQVNYHRAIEGELERSVISIREVERARVHITMPKDSLYKEQREPAKASILVKLRPNASLTPQNVAAITHLAASAVPGLQADQVTVLDTDGNLLNRPRPAGLDDGGAGEGVLEYRKGVEHEMQAKIAETLEPLLGAGHFRIGVSADIDRTSADQSEEIFDPDKSVMVSSQTSQDLPAAAAAEGGVPGSASNLPRAEASRAAAGASTTAYGRRTENISYQTSRTVRHTRIGQGAVKRLSLSILVDHSLRFQEGKPVVEAPAAEKLKVIQDLVAAAVGLDTGRGDQLVVEAFPFESTLNAQPPSLDGPEPAPVAAPPAIPLPSWLTSLVGGNTVLVLAIGAGLGLVVMGGAVFFLLRRGRKKKATAQVATPQLRSPTDDAQKQIEARLAEQAAEQARKEAEAILALKLPTVSTKKTEVLTKHISAEAKKDPQATAHVVRSWLHGEYQR